MSDTQKRATGASGAAIVLANLLVWGQTVGFGFVWDDRYFIQRLQSIRSLANIPRMFYALDAQSAYPEGFLVFRPLRTVFYALLYALGGGEPPRPALFHLANLAWHIGAALLFFDVAKTLLAKMPGGDPDNPKVRWLALFLALAFSVNPVVSETVCWAKSLDDIMAAVSTLLALRALLQWNGDNKRPLVWSLLWFGLAVYSKVSAVPFALLVPFLLCGWSGFSLKKKPAGNVRLCHYRRYLYGAQSSCHGTLLADRPVIGQLRANPARYAPRHPGICAPALRHSPFPH